MSDTRYFTEAYNRPAESRRLQNIPINVGDHDSVEGAGSVV